MNDTLRFDLSRSDIERILRWYAESHSTGNADEDAADDDLADVFRFRVRMAASGEKQPQ